MQNTTFVALKILPPKLQKTICYSSLYRSLIDVLDIGHFPETAETLSIEIPREKFRSQRSQFLTTPIVKSEHWIWRLEFRETADVTLDWWIGKLETHDASSGPTHNVACHNFTSLIVDKSPLENSESWFCDGEQKRVNLSENLNKIRPKKCNSRKEIQFRSKFRNEKFNLSSFFQSQPHSCPTGLVQHS